MSRPVVTVVAAPDLAGAVAGWLAAHIASSIAERGSCALALSGGHTPRPAYEALAALPLSGTVDWARVDAYFGDERAVPPDHPDSNFRLASEGLFSRVPFLPGRIHPMPADRPDRDAAAREYERLLPPRLDVLLLGMGPDGHTASLFPGSPALAERSRRVVPATAPVEPALRLTITPPVIAAARHVAIAVAGAEKAAMVARALSANADPAEVPAHLAAGAHWFLDEAAAAGLAPRDDPGITTR
jgi:6-phosphogluconolactonase